MNAKWQIPVPYGSMLHIPPTNFYLLAAKQNPYPKAYLSTKNTEEFSGEKSEENWPVGRKKTTTTSQKEKKQEEQQRR